MGTAPSPSFLAIPLIVILIHQTQRLGLRLGHSYFQNRLDKIGDGWFGGSARASDVQDFDLVLLNKLAELRRRIFFMGGFRQM